MVLTDVIGDGVQSDDGQPQELSSLCEDLVEETQAAFYFVRQDAKRPGGVLEQRLDE